MRIHMLERSDWNISRLVVSFLLPIVSAFLWFTPVIGEFLQSVDYTISLYANKSLSLNRTWAYFWGLMNMRPETYINGVIILFLNVWYVVALPRKDRIPATSMVILMWIWIQVGVVFVNGVFSDMLAVHRHSPSLVIKPFLRLSEYFSGYSIKDHSYKSFPGGHGFAMFYWAFFFTKFTPRKITVATWIIAMFFCLPRVMSGAHWVTDIIFAGFLAYFVVNVMHSTPLYGKCVHDISKLIRIAIPYYKKSVTKILTFFNS